MALQGSGTITLAQIAAEFGGSTPHSLSEYYRGGGLVPDTGANAAVPTSGAISLSNFYGAAAASPVSGSTSGSSTAANINSLSVSFNTDGSISYTGAESSGGLTGWFSPITGGIGSSYYVRFTNINEDVASVTSNDAASFTLMNATRSLAGSSANANGTIDFDAQIATDSGGSNIVATITVSLGYIDT